MPSIRTSEVLAALSLTTDLTSGVPFEEGLGVGLVATALAGVLGLDEDDRRVVFHAALLRAVGCTSHASENAELFGDDIRFQGALRVLDPGDAAVFREQLARFGDWNGPAAQPEHAARFQRIAATEGPIAAGNGCDVSRALGPRLGLPPDAVTALDDVHERWDGLGIPSGRAGDDLTVAGRIVHVAEQAVRAHAVGGRVGAVAEVRRRAGGHLDPDLAAAFDAAADEVLAPLGEPDRLAAVVAAEPGRPATVPAEELDRLALALAIVVDLKGRYLLGHSAHVAALTDSAARLFGLSAPYRADARAAALLHDLGRAAVPSSVWDRPGPLGSGEWEQVRLHAYWTERVLQRCPSLARLAPLAGAHHERQDGSGYHRGARTIDLPAGARLIAAADVFAAMTEPRPHRPRLDAEGAVRELREEAARGRLDRDACAAVIEAAGFTRPRMSWPAELSDREVEVLRLTARGLSNRRIAAELSVSERTVGHHLGHIYDKIGRRTRAGAAVFAMEHGLLPG